jgi:hypothetical protein
MSRREDFLVSVCFTDATIDVTAEARLREFAGALNAAWAYCEILIVSDTVANDRIDALLADIPNMRFLRTRGLSESYRRRVIGASEAIGDLVVLGALDEVAHLDIPGMLVEAAETGAVIVARRDESAVLLDGLLSLLGRSSGFHVQARDMQTAVLPRTLLNRLLARPDRLLSLRFMPRDGGVPVRYSPLTSAGRPVRVGGVGRRLAIIQRLLVHSAPMVLNWISLLSILAVLGGLSFTVYAICVWLLVEPVQPGWFTTSLAISMTALFLGVAIFGLASGLLKLIELVTPDALDDVVDERGHADLFARIVSDLNVERVQGSND